MKQKGFAPILILLFGVVIAFFSTRFAIDKAKSDKLERSLPTPTATQASSVYTYVDPNKIFSVQFPSDWFSSAPAEELFSEPKRASCDKTAKDCLAEIISVKIINNKNDQTLAQVVNSQQMKEIPADEGRQKNTTLGNTIPAIIVDNISENNVNRNIYFKNGNTVVEVSLTNSGSEDVNQFISTFRLLKG